MAFDEPQPYLVGGGIWLVLMVILWKLVVMGDYGQTQKIIISVVMLPLSIIIANMMIER